MAVGIPRVKQAWTDGSGGGTPISAARLNDLEEGIFDVSLAPAVRVFHNANQSITTSTLTALAFNSERFDQVANAASTMHDTAINNTRLTCRYAGVYLIGANIDWASSALGYRQVSLRIGGATTIAHAQQTAVNGVDTTQVISAPYAMAVNDYVEVMVFQTSGGALGVNTNANFSPEFWMVRVA